MKDFTVKRAKVEFNIDHADGTPDTFEGVPGLPALALVSFSGLVDQQNDKMTIDEQVKFFIDLFGMILVEDSAARFVARMSNRDDPVEMDQVNAIMPWVMEQYGMRPTLPSEPSSSGSASPDDGKTSTADAPPEVSTSEISPQTVSST